MAFTSQHGGNIREAAASMGVEPHELIDFSANINPLGMPASLKQAIIDNLSLAEHYPDEAYQDLHDALARHHGVSADWVLAGNGETELIFNLVKQLAPKRALLLTPGFAEYRRALDAVMCEIREYSLSETQDWQPDEQFLAALTPDLDCLFLCTPNNPTGLMPDRHLLDAIVARCCAMNIAVIIDEAFLDFIPADPGFIPRLSHYPQLYILRSVTKFFAIPGLRLGYLVSRDIDTVSQIRKRREPWTINAFAALAGERVFHDHQYIEASHTWLKTERSRLFAQLTAMTALRVWPPAANYIFLRCERPGLALQQALLKRKILIRSCANYPGLDGRYYRVAIKSEADNNHLLAALRDVFSDKDVAGG
ncbi:threonine-phosphate decarboxylase CobD [Citrobacter sp. JGM124]|uniref:threonine-phosphate decarboxylase CobD n=1 Tax=Citrobacter sp. JGM124 TaxID=2799789 RepID=UPI001BAAF01A|nr:threonine-phosphate decarboxylase CobD [Citrobacter sp. JGM124]MBS0848629.1 threonine-phosphate decarboxylase [Citrobacter sp. JGM124]